MHYAISTKADSTFDTESQSELLRNLPEASEAEIGDSITIAGLGDRIKVTVLGVIDPAVLKRPGIAGIFKRLSGEEEDPNEASRLRYVGVRLRMRNLEQASQFGVLQGTCGGVLFDTEGKEYASTGDSLEDYETPWPPNRGEQPKLSCDCFRLPFGATPARYILAIDSSARAPAGRWKLTRSRAPSPELERGLSPESQLQLLETGVEAWNAWRAKNRNIEVHLAGARLNGRNLKKIDLSGANPVRRQRPPQRQFLQGSCKSCELRQGDCLGRTV